MGDNISFAFGIALEAILANRVRSLLTALGIIFGVSAVIAMLAIGNGAQQEIIEQMKLIGVNNIVIQPVVEQIEGQVSEDQEDAVKSKKFSPGLRVFDMQNIQEVIPGIVALSPEIEIDSYVMRNGLRRSAKIIGVDTTYFQVYDFSLAQGSLFSSDHLYQGDPVCIIGKSIAARFFSKEDPIGKRIKCGGNWLTVVGVLAERYYMKRDMEDLGIRNSNLDVYVPIQTMFVRYRNRAKLSKESIDQYNTALQNSKRGNGAPLQKDPNYHQLDRLIVQVGNTNELSATSEIIRRLLTRRHNQVVDFQITIPELLLKQQQRTNDIFNMVLGAIAGISLLVGGIGIMNIMLASVMERIKEIGLRVALGAKKKDIVAQFLMEAVLISVFGGVLGILLGTVLSIGVSKVAEIPTVISLSSIILSFGVSVAVGVLFGYMPAKRAASQNPIESLRYE